MVHLANQLLVPPCPSSPRVACRSDIVGTVQTGMLDRLPAPAPAVVRQQLRTLEQADDLPIPAEAVAAAGATEVALPRGVDLRDIFTPQMLQAHAYTEKPLAEERQPVAEKDMRLPEDRREAEYDRALAAAPWQAKLIKLADVYDNLADCREAHHVAKAAEKAQRALVLAAGVAELEHAAGCVTEFLHTINAGGAAVS